MVAAAVALLALTSPLAPWIDRLMCRRQRVPRTINLFVMMVVVVVVPVTVTVVVNVPAVLVVQQWL